MPEREESWPAAQIARSFDGINTRLDSIDAKIDRNLVGRAEYDEAQRHADTRMRAIEQDVKEVKDTVGKLSGRDDDRRRWMVSTYVAPVIVAILTVALMNALQL